MPLDDTIGRNFQTIDPQHMLSQFNTNAQQQQNLKLGDQNLELGKYHIETAKLKQQLDQEDKADMDTLSREFANPAYQKLDEEGRPTMDWDSFRQSIASKVKLRTLQKLDADHLTQMKAAEDFATASKYNKTAGMQQRVAQNTLIGQELKAISQIPDAQKPAYYEAARKRLQMAGVDMSGYPDTIPADGSYNDHLTAMMASVGYDTKALSDAKRKAETNRLEAQTTLADATASNRIAEEEAKKTSRKKEQAVQEYELIPKSSDPEAAHAKWLAKWSTDFPELATLDKYGDTNRAALQAWALSTKERTTADSTVQRERDNVLHQLEMERQGRDRADIQRKRLEQGRAGETARALELDAQKHDELQRKEQEQWAQNQRIWDVLGNVKDGEEFHDPRRTTPSEYATKMTPELRKDLQSAQKKVEAQAIAFQNQAKEIRRRHDGGEFEKKIAKPAAGLPSSVNTWL